MFSVCATGPIDHQNFTCAPTTDGATTRVGCAHLWLCSARALLSGPAPCCRVRQDFIALRRLVPLFYAQPGTIAQPEPMKRFPCARSVLREVLSTLTFVRQASTVIRRLIDAIQAISAPVGCQARWNAHPCSLVQVVQRPPYHVPLAIIAQAIRAAPVKCAQRAFTARLFCPSSRVWLERIVRQALLSHACARVAISAQK
jgi:hypothetical protein